MQILVTGGCGFIGSHVVDALVADGHRVTVLDNLSSGTRNYLNTAALFIEGDVTNALLVQNIVQKADAVIHLAAIASVAECTRNWLHAHHTNVTGTVTILDAARANKTPIIYASSAAVYGDNPHPPFAETSDAKPMSAYGLDKLCCEKNAEIAWKFYGIPSVGLRFFNVYGLRQDANSPYSGVISKFIASAETSQSLTFFGDGEQTRDFIHISDIVALILAALTPYEGAHVVNGCTGQATSLKQLAHNVGLACGVPLTISHAPAREGDIRHSFGDPTHAKKLLGVSSNVKLLDGLTQLLKNK